MEMKANTAKLSWSWSKIDEPGGLDIFTLKKDRRTNRYKTDTHTAVFIELLPHQVLLDHNDIFEQNLPILVSASFRFGRFFLVELAFGHLEPSSDHRVQWCWLNNICFYLTNRWKCANAFLMLMLSFVMVIMGS
jgi:hypothetical protein